LLQCVLMSSTSLSSTISSTNYNKKNCQQLSECREKLYIIVLNYYYYYYYYLHLPFLKDILIYLHPQPLNLLIIINLFLT